MITTLYNSYLKFNGAYKFNGDLSISAVADPDTKVLTKPLTFHAEGDGTAVVKVNGNTMLTINADGRLTTNGQAASGNNDIVTKVVTDAISNSLSSLTTRVYNLEQSVSQQSPNKVLSTGKAATDYLAFDGQFNVSSINILVATTENIVLDGTETSAVDGVSLSNDDLILVKNQTDETENGVYKFVSNSGWDRAADFNTPEKLKGLILKIADGTINKGKMFYMINEVVPESYGTASVFIAEYFGSIKPLANKLIMRDEYGRAQVAAPVNACDIARKYEIDSLYGNVLPSVAGVAAVGTCTTFARSDHVHPVSSAVCVCMPTSDICDIALLCNWLCCGLCCDFYNYAETVIQKYKYQMLTASSLPERCSAQFQRVDCDDKTINITPSLILNCLGADYSLGLGTAAAEPFAKFMSWTPNGSSWMETTIRNCTEMQFKVDYYCQCRVSCVWQCTYYAGSCIINKGSSTKIRSVYVNNCNDHCAYLQISVACADPILCSNPEKPAILIDI